MTNAKIFPISKSEQGATATFVQRFGSSPCRYLHSHCCVIDGVVEPAAHGRTRLYPSDPTAWAHVEALADQVRRRVLR